MKNALKFLSGSFATYALMAACSATPGVSGPRPTGAAGALAMAMGGAVTGGGAPATNEPDGSDVGRSGAGPAQSGSGGSIVTDPVPDASAEPAMDGTRLKAIYLVGADGARQWNYAWWDSERNEECTFTAFSDGTTRCTPTTSGATAGVFFSDAGCSSPLFYAATTSQCAGRAPLYGLGAAAIACGAVTFPGIYTLTPASPAQVFQGTPSACTAAAATTITSYVFYTGTPIALSSFASATKQHG